MEAEKAEAGAVLFVAEAGTEANGTEYGRPPSRVLNDQFPFEPFLVKTAPRERAPADWAGRGRGLRCQNHAMRSARIDGRGRRCLGAEAKQTPPTAEIRRGGIVERVLL